MIRPDGPNAIAVRLPAHDGHRAYQALEERIANTRHGRDHLHSGGIRAGRRFYRPGGGACHSPTSRRRSCCRASARAKGLYPAIDPAAVELENGHARESSGARHYMPWPRKFAVRWRNTQSLKDIIAMLGLEQLVARRSARRGHTRAPAGTISSRSPSLRDRAVQRASRGNW